MNPTPRMAGGRQTPAYAADAGYAMAVLLVAIACIGIIIAVAMPAWRAVVQREKEEELMFRGGQYVRAIELFQRKFANAYPPSLDMLVEQRFLRRKYADPMTGDGEFTLLYQNSIPQRPGRADQPGSTVPGQTAGSSTQPFGQGQTVGGTAGAAQGGIIGVASKSTEASFRLFNGRSKYSEWQFVWLPRSGQGGRGSTTPGGGMGGRGRGGNTSPGPGAGQTPRTNQDPGGAMRDER
jgi:type II secretory pathway pseudopilin PulG